MREGEREEESQNSRYKLHYRFGDLQREWGKRLAKYNQELKKYFLGISFFFFSNKSSE